MAASSSYHFGPPHPRRPAAQRSVSLKHQSSSNSPKNSTSPEYDNSSGSPSSIIPLVSKNSSGESSNVDKWFDRSNNHVNGDKVVDNDPPFFLQQSSSEESPNRDHPNGANFANSAETRSRPVHPTLMHADSDESGSSDFRAVIDDLTVENKKLRRRLRKYEKLQDAHLNNEKLFEVRVHGLTSTKRAELEALLRQFAIAAAAPSNPSNATASAGGSAPLLKTQQSASASSNFADSAYISASGPASASASGQGSSGAASNSMSGQTRQAHRKSARSSINNIQSYLHDIPEGLLPHHPAVMTESTKQKVVIRRLEQIFAGTGAVQGDHHHPLQQQEVSQLAAKADRNAMEATGQNPALEGNREAPIMPIEREELVRRASSEENENTSSDSATGIPPSHKIAGHDFASASPDQRPTRPLDLDPHRAQNSHDNIEYIRHLGFSPPHVQTMETPEDGHGWIYLNFLTNLAQLHTMNVTVDFVKKALSERASKLELSEDGRKVRWKGGKGVTRMSSDSGHSPAEPTKSPLGKSPLKRSKSPHHSENDQSQHPKKRLLTKQDSKFVYTPLFFHRDNNDDSAVSSSSEAESDSQFLHVPGGESSAMTGSGVRTLSAKRHKKVDNGPMIFYSNAKFCTDLSGDPKTEVSMAYNPITYRVVSDRAVGTDNPQTYKQQNAFDNTRGSLDPVQNSPEAMDVDDNLMSEAKDLQFPGHTPLSQSSGGFVRSPIELQASGVGGVSPADNFAINVRTTLVHADNLDLAPNFRKQYSSKLAGVLQRSDPHHDSKLVLKEDLVQMSCQRLPPSELPPASCWVGDEDSDDDMSEAESYQPFSQYMDHFTGAPSAAPQTITRPYLNSDESDADEMSDVEDNGDDDDDDDDSQSDGSLDLLATAREHDPDTVRAREREYDAHMAERLAEDIPAGSSAATAGGGSGFASPASGADVNEYRKARMEHMKKRAQASSSSTVAQTPSFQRTDTGDSMVS